jgi:signal transduction histidine kinase
MLVRSVALFTTLLASAYMVTSIKSRIEERGRRVEIELARYRDLDKAKSDFILQVTHELRGPLAALTGYHEMMLKGIVGEIGPRVAETILKANRRTENLLTIIDEMIDFAYMKSSAEAAPEKRSLALKEAIDYNLELFAARAAEKSIALVSSCAHDVTAWAARDLLNIILGNLIGNAVKYSPTGTTVTVNAANEGECVHLLVRDEGIGIEPGELERIFEEFYRTQRARRLERDGTGLGLPIVKRAVDALDGRISVYSEVERGTTFHVYLPRKGDKA